MLGEQSRKAEEWSIGGGDWVGWRPEELLPGKTLQAMRNLSGNGDKADSYSIMSHFQRHSGQLPLLSIETGESWELHEVEGLERQPVGRHVADFSLLLVKALRNLLRSTRE